MKRMSEQGGKAAADEVVKVGIVGGGIFAQKFHVPCLNELTSVFTVVGVYSRSEKSATATKLLVKSAEEVVVYFGEDGLDKLLGNTNIDAVVVCLPIDVQPQVVLKALKAGKHVLSEKPVAPYGKIGEQLLAEYKQYPQLVWGVAENYIYEPYFLEAKKYINEGKIGSVRVVNVNFFNPITEDNPYYHTSWRQTPNHLGGYVLDGGVHILAAMRLILGDIEEVIGFEKQYDPRLPPSDSLVSSFRFKSGVIGNLTISFACSGLASPFKSNAPPQFFIFGDKGFIALSRHKLDIRYEVNGETVTESPTLERRENLTSGVNELTAFAAAIHAKRNNEDISSLIYSPQEALQDVYFFEAIYNKKQ